MKRSRMGLVLSLVLIAMNTLDAAITLWWWKAGLGEEVNPLLNSLMKIDPTVTMIGKTLVVNLLVVWLWATYVPEKLPRTFAAICAVYVVIMYLHLRLILGVL